MEPLVSIFMSTIRSYNWPILHENFSTSSTPFELICVGPVEPDFTMPDNMKFIYSEVKPAQCAYIGAQAATGKYVMSISDDEKVAESIIDHFVNEAENCPNIDNTIITPDFTRHGQDFFGVGDYSTPVLPIGMFMTKELWDRYGIDKNFYGVYWDTDIGMMNHAAGGTIIRCEHVLSGESLPVRAGGRASTCFNDGRVGSRSRNDRMLFYSRWLKEPGYQDFQESGFEERFHRSSPPRGSWIRKERARPLDPIVDSDDILTVSQGVQ